MDAHSLQARLTWPLLWALGTIIVLVGASSVVVTRRMLDASDSEVAMAHARNALDALALELAEGDSFDDGAREVIFSDARAGGLLRLRADGRERGDLTLPVVQNGECVTFSRGNDEPWRACAIAHGSREAVAAISMGGHRAAVASLARGMCVVVALAILALWLVMRRTLRGPIAELAALVAWTTRILETESPRDPPAAATMEVAKLAAAFDALVRRLLETLARERAASAHIAHELRTPMTTIRHELETIQPADAPSALALDRARRDIVRFADVIDAILVLSEPPREAGAEAGGAIVNVADMARELAPPGARVDAPDEALVIADEPLVRLAMRNLIENAERYAGAARGVRVTRNGDALRITIVDEGPGIEPGARDRMFDRYWRGTADGDGRGLGLALVRAVAERHGGAVHADAGEGGRGLLVSFTLGRLLEWRESAPQA